MCFAPRGVINDCEGLAGRRLRQFIESGPPSIGGYEPLLPVRRVPDVDLSPGYTPLLRASGLGRALGLSHLYIKNDTVNPTWSFKDRVVAVAIAAALRFQYEVVACASTGNLANAVAAHAARAGLRACVFIPNGLERGKGLTTSAYGPTLVGVDGAYDDVKRFVAEICGE